MVEIFDKAITVREAVACGEIIINTTVLKRIKADKIPKGKVIATAVTAGIMAAKQTPLLLPLCHPIAIEGCTIDVKFKSNSLLITATVKGCAKTGFEMEALTAVSVAALTIYDMCKAFDKEMTIGPIQLLKKSGGKSGVYVRKNK